MKKPGLKTILIFFSICFCLTTPNQIQAQEKTNYLNYQQIISKLTFTSRISKSTEQINEELIKEIQAQKVDFILTSKDEEELKKAGASDLLIKTIDSNTSDETKENLIKNLWTMDNIHGRSPKYFENLEKAIKFGKQFIRVFENDAEYETQVKYLKKKLPKAEKELAEYKQENKLEKTVQINPPEDLNKLPPKQDKYFEEAQAVYQRYIDNYRGNTEQKKTALETAKEFVKKYGNDKEFNPQIEYLKKAISRLEEMLRPDEPDRNINYDKFNQALKGKKWDELFEIGAKIFKDEPNYLDLALLLASIGYDEVAKKNPKSENLAKAVFFADVNTRNKLIHFHALLFDPLGCQF